MVRHIVMFKLKEFASPAEKQAKLDEIKTKLEALIDKIDVLRSIEVKFNCNPAETWDLILITELDSLADDVTFGVAPSAMVFSLFHEVTYPEFLMPVAEYMPYTAFLISVFSALRLGKFNIDPRQSTSFIGLPTPANTLFWASLIVGAHDFLVSDSFNALWLLVMVIVMSLLLIAEIPMFSLKFKNLSWEHNKTSYIFLIVSIPLLIFLRTGGFAAVIVWYILLSLITGRKKKQ